MTSSPGVNPWPVDVHASIDSTNEAAKRLARTRDLSPRWIRAQEQTAGRGRQGRGWASPVGNLFTSALFPLPGGYTHALSIPFLAAIAVAETVETLAPGTGPRLKWPNDVRIAGQKISGILIETGSSGETVWCVAGIGLNISHTPKTAGQAATSIAELRGDTLIDAAMAMEVLASRFAAHMARLEDGFAPIRTTWLARAEGLGETVSVRTGTDETRLQGVFEDLAPDGGLILRLPDGTRQTIRAGDVDLVRRT